jgi:uncharacterized protein
MEWALLSTGLLMGLAGGAHCLAMCSPACAAVARGCAGVQPQSALLALLGGRAVGYAAAGALVAASVGVLGGWATSASWLRPLWSMLHLAAFALGVWLLWAGRQPAWMAGLGQAAPQRDTSAAVPIQVMPLHGPGRIGANAGRSAARASLVGSLLVLLPCGLLQSALLVAALASTPVSGGLVMLIFALASGLSLWAGPALWFRLGGRDRAAHWQSGAVRLSGVMLAGASAWALMHRMAEPALCVTP